MNRLELPEVQSFIMIDVATGETLWKHESGDHNYVLSYLLWDEENDFLVGFRHRKKDEEIFAVGIDLKTGEERWTHFVGDRLTWMGSDAKGGVFLSVDYSVPSLTWLDTVLAWLRINGPADLQTFRTLDMKNGRMIAEWPRLKDAKAKFLDDGTLSIITAWDDHVEVERWSPDPPYRWEWILGIPVGILATFESLRYWRSRRRAAKAAA